MPAVDAFRIEGGHPLSGEVEVVGAKNSVLKLMAAALLAIGRSELINVPRISDVEIMAELITRLGCNVELFPEERRLTIDVPAELQHRADYDLVRQMRASVSVLGPLTARLGAADIALPGGDAIGSRGLDMHLTGLERMGAKVTSQHGYLMTSAPEGLTGASHWLDFPSVGATETLLMAGVTASIVRRPSLDHKQLVASVACCALPRNPWCMVHLSATLLRKGGEDVRLMEVGLWQNEVFCLF